MIENLKCHTAVTKLPQRLMTLMRAENLPKFYYLWPRNNILSS
jgi:hypothetical protein